MPSTGRGTERPRAPLLESCFWGGVLRLIEVLFDEPSKTLSHLQPLLTVVSASHQPSLERLTKAILLFDD